LPHLINQPIRFISPQNLASHMCGERQFLAWQSLAVNQTSS
jgi:hypothetical protein